LRNRPVGDVTGCRDASKAACLLAAVPRVSSKREGSWLRYLVIKKISKTTNEIKMAVSESRMTAVEKQSADPPSKKSNSLVRALPITTIQLLPLVCCLVPP
jgi:hypothetical protein